MKNRLIIISLASTLVAAGCIGPAPTESRRLEASPGVYSVADAQNAKRVEDVLGNQEVRCKRRRSIGSNLIRNVCTTRTEADEMREMDQETLREYQRKHGIPVLLRIPEPDQNLPGGG